MDQTPRWMSQVKNCGTHGKVIHKVVVFKKYAKLQGQGHRIIDVVTCRKVLSQNNTNVNYQSSSTHCLKVISKLNVFND